MIQIFEHDTKKIVSLIDLWQVKLLSLAPAVIAERRNSQNRNIKQILGHLIDSASNNTHRIVHLQYQNNPLQFPNYATEGNNDRWIEIQNFNSEDWENLVQLWKYINLHLVHVINNIKVEKLANEWIASPENYISLEKMVLSYLDHFELHLNEMDELIKRG
jgi:hypothetical protein